MILVINTSQSSCLEIRIKDKNKTLIQSRIKARFNQSESLLKAIKKILDKANLEINKIKKIQVVSEGETFTGLRIGVTVANALAYALAIPIEALNIKGKKEVKSKVQNQDLNLVFPRYDKDPNITKKKQVKI